MSLKAVFTIPYIDIVLTSFGTAGIRRLLKTTLEHDFT